MGTKAYIKIQGCNKIIGMISDGSLNNLRWVVQELVRWAIKNRCLTKFRHGDVETVTKVVTQFVNTKNDWLFLDSPDNPEWVSYSAEVQLLPVGPTIATGKFFIGDLRSYFPQDSGIRYIFPRHIYR